MDKRVIGGAAGLALLGVGLWLGTGSPEPEAEAPAPVADRGDAEPAQEDVAVTVDAPEAAPTIPKPPPLPVAPPKMGMRLAKMCFRGAPDDDPDLVALAELIDINTQRDAESRRRVEELHWRFIKAEPGGCAVSWVHTEPGPHFDAIRAHYEELAAQEDVEASVLSTFARLVTVLDSDRALELYGRLQEMEPENPDWLQREAHLHSLDLKSIEKLGGDPREVAARAQQALETGLELAADGPQRTQLLAEAVKAAALAGDLDGAESWGRELLSRAGERDNHARFVGHEGLGLAALARGDAEGAIAELLQMSDVPPGPVQKSFGPSMLLANKLLAAGHADAVISYLEKVATFWEPEGVAEWVAAIRDGQTLTLNRFNVPRPTESSAD